MSRDTGATIGTWLGLCRRPPAVHPLEAAAGIMPGPDWRDRTGGRPVGPGTIRRGTGAAIEGIKTLIRNPQLLKFSLVAGLVLAGTAVGHAALSYISWTLQPCEAGWFALNVLIEFATIICLVFLLTGLILSIASKTGDPASFREGLRRALEYRRAIVVWSALLTLAGMLLFGMFFYSADWLPRNHPLPGILGTIFGSILTPLMEFPFNPSLTPYIFLDPARYGGTSISFWLYPSGIMQAAIFSEINLLLVILTPFVIPAIVLEQKTPGEAVARSIAMMRKNWGETAACAAFIGLVVAGVTLTYLLVQAASGMGAPDAGLTTQPEFSWMVFALVYDAALFGFTMVMATAGSIAMLNLYRSARCRHDNGISAAGRDS